MFERWSRAYDQRFEKLTHPLQCPLPLVPCTDFGQAHTTHGTLFQCNVKRDLIRQSSMSLMYNLNSQTRANEKEEILPSQFQSNSAFLSFQTLLLRTLGDRVRRDRNLWKKIHFFKICLNERSVKKPFTIASFAAETDDAFLVVTPLVLDFSVGLEFDATTVFVGVSGVEIKFHLKFEIVNWIFFF